MFLGGNSFSKHVRVNANHVKFLATATAVAVGTGAYVQHRQNVKAKKPVQISATLADAIAGALGEVAQIAILYPLDTVKVRCQTAGLSAGAVMQDMLKGGVNLGLAKQLYAGVVGAALCSILVGAVHYASYESSKRWTLRCVKSISAMTNPDKQRQQGSEGGAAAAAVDNPKSTGVLVNILAAAVCAVATALVEAPVELFRHNQQAGLVKHDFVREMVNVARTEGISGLYWGFLPHCFEAWPHDLSELVVYGALKDVHVVGSHPSSTKHTWVIDVPLQAWDLMTGATAGTAAVIVSMPFDCVKTYMQTHGTDVAGLGVRGGSMAFIRTGHKLVVKGGLGALYVGVVPRLLQQVPSAMMCWWTIEAVKRALQPYIKQEGKDTL